MQIVYVFCDDPRRKNYCADFDSVTIWSLHIESGNDFEFDNQLFGVYRSYANAKKKFINFKVIYEQVHNFSTSVEDV